MLSKLCLSLLVLQIVVRWNKKRFGTRDYKGMKGSVVFLKRFLGGKACSSLLQQERGSVSTAKLFLSSLRRNGNYEEVKF